MNQLSEAALNLLCRRLASERVAVDEATRPLYRELVAVGLMIPLHTFANGNEGSYRLTYAACDLRDAGLIAPATLTPSDGAAPVRRD